jgi:hypothetical protein
MSSDDTIPTAIATLRAYAAHCHDETATAGGVLVAAYEEQVKQIDSQAKLLEHFQKMLTRWREAHGEQHETIQALVVERDGLRQSNASLHKSVAMMGNALLDAERELAAMRAERDELRAVLHQIADRPDAEMATAQTLHYDMRGWALAALARGEARGEK